MKLGMQPRGLLPIIVCSNDDPGVTDLFYGKVKSGNLGFSMGTWENSGYLRNYCSQWPENL